METDLENLYKIMLKYKGSVQQDGNKISTVFYWQNYLFINKYFIDKEAGRIVHYGREEAIPLQGD